MGVRYRPGERGATKVEVILGSIVLGAVALAVVVVGMRSYAVVVGETHHATVVDGHQFSHPADAPPAEAVVEADGPVTVSVVAAGTVADDAAGDSCGLLPGQQPHEADCDLPLFVAALDLSGSGTVRYACADREHYEVRNGQAVEPHKQCVLKSAARQD